MFCMYRLYYDVITLHGEEKDGISTLDEVSALGSEVGQIHRGAGSRPSEIRGAIRVFDLNANLARIIPEKLVRICDKRTKQKTR